MIKAERGQGTRLGQGQIFGAVKGSSMKICWVKILTPVAGGSTGTYVVSRAYRPPKASISPW